MGVFMESVLSAKNKKSILLLTIIVFLLEFIYGISNALYIVLTPHMISFYNSSYTEMASLNSLWGIGSITSILILMVVLDKHSKPRVLFLIVIAFLISLLMQGIAPPFIYLQITNILWGASSLALDAVNAATLVDIYGSKSKVYVNILQGTYAVGCILGPVCAQLVLNIGFQWNIAYMFFAYSIIAIIPIFMFILFRNKEFIKNLNKANELKIHEKEISIKQFTGHKQVQLAMIIIFLVNGAQAISQSWIVQYMSADLHSPENISAAVSSIYFIGLALSRFLSPIFYKKHDSIKILAIVMFIGGIATFFAYMNEYEYVIAAGSFFFGIAMGNASPLLISHLCSVFPGQSGRATTFLYIGMGISSILFAFIGGEFITLFGLKLGISLSILLIVIAVIPTIKLSKINVSLKKADDLTLENQNDLPQ